MRHRQDGSRSEQRMNEGDNAQRSTLNVRHSRCGRGDDTTVAGLRQRFSRTFHCILLLAAATVGAAAFAAPDAVPFAPGGQWTFDGSLADSSGNGLHAGVAGEPQYVAARDGQALRLEGTAAGIPDAPGLRLARGLRLEARVRFDALAEGNAWTDVVMKGGYSRGEYVLRVNPESEGRQFGFFVNTGVWEQRVSGRARVVTNVWYDVAAGWDEQGLWLTVNGETTRVARSGQPTATWEPLRVGPFHGEIDALRVRHAGDGLQGVGLWPFEGDLRDRTGHGRDWRAAGASFVPADRGGRALNAASAAPELPSHADLQLAPGFRLDCAVLFNEVPATITPIVVKEGEYMLRLDAQSEGGQLAFFVNLNGNWEPRARAAQRVKPGIWHYVSARWNGFELTLEVNGERSEVMRAGVPRPGRAPLRLGRFNGAIDNLHIENPRPTVMRLRDLTTHAVLLHAGQPVRVSGQVINYAQTVTGCVVTVDLPPGVTCDTPVSVPLAPLVQGEPQAVEWVLRANTGQVATAALRLTANGETLHQAAKTLPFFGAADSARGTGAWAPPPRPDSMRAATYYVDSACGDNANSGMSPAAAWRDFTPVNGRTLGPGERLLLRRGSVFNQELALSARGTPEAWAEIGSYGEGARPVIRRNWDIDERCSLIESPDYLVVRGLTVCFAGKGFVVHYARGGHRGLLIEDCVAHHIEGLYRHNSHGIPEWLHRRGAPGDGSGSSGFGVSGSAASMLVLRDCEMFQCSSGFRFSGHDVTLDRVFCHDNFTHNTSPHPFLTSVWRAYLQNSVFDAAGWHAYAGTMGIMLANQNGLIIRNCHFLNQPDSGSHDEGGIDFEAGGDGCLIDRCTFRNNAGAAIEVLGLKSPQARNVEIANSRFIRNNVANKLGPSEIFIWGGSRDPEVCCSTGLIRDNGYVLKPGVLFFTNQAPALTRWTVTNNTRYATCEELDRALPLNDPPQVEAGREIWTDRPRVRLAGAVTDDARPAPARLAVHWELLHGPGTAAFDDPSAADTVALFSAPGDYQLRLVADDGELWRSALTTVHVLPPRTEVARAWTFEATHDKEGWSDWNLGTRDREWLDQKWACISRPVKHVAGGFYIVAVEESAEAHLLSADALGVSLASAPRFTICMQNHTGATHLRLRFTTDAEPSWAANLGTRFDVAARDPSPRLYTVDMRAVEGWHGRLKQLRLELADGAPVTGTCRIDYIWLGGPSRPWWRRMFGK